MVPQLVVEERNKDQIRSFKKTISVVGDFTLEDTILNAAGIRT